MKAVLDSLSALWRKAEREAYRSFHAKSKTHKADHFFNFCVTAHSLRDFFFESKNLQGRLVRDPYYAQWDADPLLVAVADIANLSKHFQLRDRKTKHPRNAATRRVVHHVGAAYDVYASDTGELSVIPRPSREITITTSDGATHELWTFAIDVLDYWRVFLAQNGVRVRRQSIAEMQDHAPGA